MAFSLFKSTLLLLLTPEHKVSTAKNSTKCEVFDYANLFQHFLFYLFGPTFVRFLMVLHVVRLFLRVIVALT